MIPLTSGAEPFRYCQPKYVYYELRAPVSSVNFYFFALLLFCFHTLILVCFHTFV